MEFVFCQVHLGSLSYNIAVWSTGIVSQQSSSMKYIVGLDILHGYLVENFVILFDQKYKQYSLNCKIHVKCQGVY